MSQCQWLSWFLAQQVPGIHSLICSSHRHTCKLPWAMVVLGNMLFQFIHKIINIHTLTCNKVKIYSVHVQTLHLKMALLPSAPHSAPQPPKNLVDEIPKTRLFPTYPEVHKTSVKWTNKVKLRAEITGYK